MGKIKLRLIIAFSLAIMILLGISVGCIYWLQKRDIEEEVQRRLSSAQSLYYEHLQEDSHLLSAQIDFLKEDNKLQDAWLAKDRDTLLDCAAPTFKRMLSKYRITHFYFHNLDKTCFLRVHNPSYYGDYINRYTLANAVLEDKPSYGVELGPLGTFTLRVVHPWRINGKLTGYIELGEEIEHIVEELTETLDVGVFITLDKSYLDRAEWEQGLKMLGRTANWDISPDFVVVSHLNKEIPREIIENLKLPQSDHKKPLFKITREGRTCKAGFVPLIDAQNRKVGDIIVTQDITERGIVLKRLTLALTSITGLIGIVLLGLLYLYIDHLVRKLQIAHKNLKAEIEIRKQAEEKLDIACQQAEAANIAKSHFLANTSHELRTPMHGILSFCKFGIKEYATAKPETLLDYFQTIEGSAETLLKLLNDLLDLAKLEAGKMKFEFLPTDLGILCAQIIDEFHLVLSERNLTIRCECNVRKKVSVDAEKIKQVLRNLISNAGKFSPDGGNIDVYMHQREDTVLANVCDQGPGIPEDELEAVFDKFVQSSRTKTGAGGTGLGLAICQEIIAAHKGRIWAENRPEGGAVFSFEIPLFVDTSTEKLVLISAGNDSDVKD